MELCNGPFGQSFQSTNQSTQGCASASCKEDFKSRTFSLNLAFKCSEVTGWGLFPDLEPPSPSLLISSKWFPKNMMTNTDFKLFLKQKVKLDSTAHRPNLLTWKTKIKSSTIVRALPVSNMRVCPNDLMRVQLINSALTDCRPKQPSHPSLCSFNCLLFSCERSQFDPQMNAGASKLHHNSDWLQWSCTVTLRKLWWREQPVHRCFRVCVCVFPWQLKKKKERKKT